MKQSVGSILKQWRKSHRFSQLSLAVELNISSKHISFIETGRSQPSKEMILKIATFLFIPKGEVNRAMYSTGYAPIYKELPLSDKSLKPILEAINRIVENHLPYPAIVLNQSWDVIMVNKSAQKLLSDLGYTQHTNLIEAIISDRNKTSKIVNWHEAIASLLIRLNQEISTLGNHQRLQEYVVRLSSCLLKSEYDPNMANEDIIFSTKFKLNEKILSFFSTVVQLSNVQDITVSEYRVELMFPSDEATKQYYL